jgi:hypothetical protein
MKPETQPAASSSAHRIVGCLAWLTVAGRGLLTVYFFTYACGYALLWPLLWRDSLWNLAIAIIICPAWDDAANSGNNTKSVS